VCLEIIATTYYSTIFKTHVFSLNSHLCIYVSMYLCIYVSMHLCIYIVTSIHTVYLDWLQAVLVLRGFLTPKMNTIFIELSTAAYLKSLSLQILS
jgi:hypothetical protein